MGKLFILPFLLILMDIIPAKKIKIVFFGDSITQQGIDKDGYIDLIQNAITDNGSQHKYELTGAGIGGNKVDDLYLRMEEDVLTKKPDTVVIYVGINDVWHKQSHGTGTDLEKYEKFYAAIIKKFQAKEIRVVVCTPTVIGELKNNANPQDDDLEKYSAVIRQLASSYNCTLVDLRKTFSDYELKNNNANAPSGILTRDGVHLNNAGNQLVAEEMMKIVAIP